MATLATGSLSIPKQKISPWLGKIQNGTFGICEGTGKPINKPRLEAQPWARFSIEYARSLERGGMGIKQHQ